MPIASYHPVTLLSIGSLAFHFWKFLYNRYALALFPTSIAERKEGEINSPSQIEYLVKSLIYTSHIDMSSHGDDPGSDFPEVQGKGLTSLLLMRFHY